MKVGCSIILQGISSSLSLSSLFLPMREKLRISDEPRECRSPVHFITTPNPLRYKLRTCWRKYQVMYWNKLISSHYCLLRGNDAYIL
jgi:hypothetical protein